MIYYAIRQKSTGFFMPQSSKKKHGYTWDYPESCRQSPPRLFLTRNRANRALGCWLRGIWEVKSIWHGEYGEDIDYYNEPREVPGRDRDDMEVVEIVIPLLDDKKPKRFVLSSRNSTVE